MTPYVVLSCFILRKASLLNDILHVLNPGFFLLVHISTRFEKGFVSMAYGDVGGPNLDFSNMDGIPTTEEVYALVVFIAFFIGIPSYLLVRKIWKVIKRRICVKDLENEIDEEFDEEDRSLGRHLPVTEKELFEFRVKEIKKRKRKEEIKEGNKLESITVKEEIVLLSSFLFVIYLFWNNGL